MENLTWKCVICGEERPDNEINVLTYPLKGLPGAEVNLKYCTKDECYKKALEKAKTGEF